MPCRVNERLVQSKRKVSRYVPYPSFLLQSGAYVDWQTPELRGLAGHAGVCCLMPPISIPCTLGRPDMQKPQNNRKQRAPRLEQALTPPSQHSTARWQADVEEHTEDAQPADVDEVPSCTRASNRTTTTVVRQPVAPAVLKEVEDEADSDIEVETDFEPAEEEQEQQERVVKATAPTERLEPAPILLAASQLPRRQAYDSPMHTIRTTPTAPSAYRALSQTQSQGRTTERPPYTPRLLHLSRLSRRPVASSAGPSLWQRINAYCQRQHWSTLVLATIGVVVCLLFLSRLCLLAWTGVHDQLNYGMPRTM